MASIFKHFTENDYTSNLSTLNESIPITGTIISGTYADENIKDYAHEMWQSVYDYPYLSSSSNHLFDLSVGVSTGSTIYTTAITASAKKSNMYGTMAQVLMGFDNLGSIREFDEDGSLAAGDKLKEVFFMSFSRLLGKDEIKKGTFYLSVLTGSTVDSPAGAKVITDEGAQNDFRVNSPVGEYGILYEDGTTDPYGLLFYQARMAVLTASLFDGEFGTTDATYATSSVNTALLSASIPDLADGLRRRITNVVFSNTTEIHSKIYFCRMGHNEFNYSSNPTYLSSSKIMVKEVPNDEPISYVTKVGLYSDDGEMLAVASLSEPLKKTPSDEILIRVRIDS